MHQTEKRFLSLLSFFLFSFFSFQANAQSGNSSPYSRYGLGDLSYGGFTKNIAMGGIGYGLSAPFNINFTNPASYSSIAITNFEASVQTNFVQYKSNTLSDTASGASISYLAFAFPVKFGKWGVSFGLIPYSKVGYNIRDSKTTTESGEINYLYQGSGGLNRFYIGSGGEIYHRRNDSITNKNMNIGFNASYLFGVLNNLRLEEFNDSLFAFNLRINDSRSVGGFNFDYGLQFTFDSLWKKTKVDSLHTIRIKSDWSLTLGVVTSLTSNIDVTQSYLAERYKQANGIISVYDTVRNETSNKGTIVLPMSIGAGFVLRKGNKLVVGADASFQDWKKYTAFGESDSLVNSMRIAAGVQFTPDPRSDESYFKRVQYRAGVHYTKTNLQLKNNQLTDAGFSIGAGFPLRTPALSAAYFHLAIEAGQRGTLDNGLLRERYFRVNFGFTFGQRWFIKSKYD